MQGIAAYADNSIVPPGAITSIRKAADMLEGFGREGDIYVVHAAEGETVVPMEVLNSSPKLKAMLFKQMTDLGLEPERYIVGNELNSINPVTGKPEFFLKKLFGNLKNVFKKAAPIIGAVAGTLIAGPLGAAFGSALGGGTAATVIGNVAGKALGSGIGSFATSKLAGADTDDALRNALIAGAAGGAFGGIQSLVAPQVSAAATQPLIGEPGVGFPMPEPSQVVEGGIGSPNLIGDDAGEILGQGITDVMDPAAMQTTVQPALPTSVAQPTSFVRFPQLPSETVEPPPGFKIQPRFSAPTRQYFQPEQVSFPGGLNPDRPSYAQFGTPAAFGGGPSPTMQQVPSIFQRAFEGLQNVPGKIGQKIVDNPVSTALTVGGAGLGVLGAYEEQQKAEDAEREAMARQEAFNRYVADAMARYRRPYIRREAGGKVPGKGEGDIVPAMLEPGEFVMNRKAVIGAGNGSQKAGIKRMYAMMRQFEGKS